MGMLSRSVSCSSGSANRSSVLATEGKPAADATPVESSCFWGAAAEGFAGDARAAVAAGLRVAAAEGFDGEVLANGAAADRTAGDEEGRAEGEEEGGRAEGEEAVVFAKGDAFATAGFTGLAAVGLTGLRTAAAYT